MNSGVLFFGVFWAKEMDKIGRYLQWLAAELRRATGYPVLSWDTSPTAYRGKDAPQLKDRKPRLNSAVEISSVILVITFSLVPLGVSCLVFWYLHDKLKITPERALFSIGFVLTFAVGIFGVLFLLSLFSRRGRTGTK